jgi:GNAT superfamily N-acetyltransferase
MSTGGVVRVVSFAHLDEPVEDFLSLPQRVEGLDDGQARAERAGSEALLSPANTFYRNAASRCFVAYRDDLPVGRVCAFHNRELVERDGPYGLVGLFASTDDSAVAAALVDGAAGWLGGRGLKVLRGPMAGDIWHRWRFMTSGFDTPSFPGEPRQPVYYPELFTAVGFAPVRTYSTKRITDLPTVLDRLRVAAGLNRKRGYTFRSLDRDHWDADMARLHELCRNSFASNWGVTSVSLEEFADIYNRWLRRVGADHVLLALDATGEVAGLGLAVVAPADTLNIRTLAVLPGHHGYGLGQAITAELYQRAIDAGHTAVQHCLMGPDAPPQRWDGGLGRVTRTYTMYERGI